MAQNRLLLLFVRNPESGKVKTRLAKDLGNEKALEIYIKLLEHTHSITQQVKAAKLVYYADEVKEHDLWESGEYQKSVQPAGDLGYKMEYAFNKAFLEGYKDVVIIGSDCLQLDQELIEQAFSDLETGDIVLGPATDGGYYLLGMKQLHSSLFRDKAWSTASVFSETLAAIKHENLTYTLLPVLSDIDRAEDVPAAWLDLK